MWSHTVVILLLLLLLEYIIVADFCGRRRSSKWAISVCNFGEYFVRIVYYMEHV